MNKRIVKCPVIGLNVNKENHCPDWECNACPINLKGKKNPQRVTLRTPAMFADAYIDNRIEIPFYIRPTRDDIEEIMTKFPLRVVSQLRLKQEIKKKLYCALYELKYAMHDSEQSGLRALNLKISKKKISVIKQLNKIIESDCLSPQTIMLIREDIRLLESYNVPSNRPYHPLDELFCLSGLLNAGSSGSLDKVCIEAQNWTHKPLKQRSGRPSNFLSKTLQIIVFKLLHEHSKIPIEKAREHTAKIINEFFNKCNERKVHFNITGHEIFHWVPHEDGTYPSITKKNVEDSLQNAEVI